MPKPPIVMINMNKSIEITENNIDNKTMYIASKMLVVLMISVRILMGFPPKFFDQRSLIEKYDLNSYQIIFLVQRFDLHT